MGLAVYNTLESRFISHGMFVYGKYAGSSIGDVARSDSQYVRWAVESREYLALTDEACQVLKRAITSALEPPPVPPPITVQPEPPPIPPEWDSVSGADDVISSDDASSLFVTADTTKEIVWTDEQRVALDAIESWYEGEQPFFALTGLAGTGKSTLIREVAKRYSGLVLTAMTGKAALRLTECAGRSASTLHKILYYPPTGGQNLRFTRLREAPGRFVCTDEASMMPPSVYGDLQCWGYDMRYLLVGDNFQLPPVITDKIELEHHGEDYSVFSEVKGVELKTVMRNAGGVLEAATYVRQKGEICSKSIPDKDGGYEYLRESNPLLRAIDSYCEDRDDHLLITWKNSTRMAANARIREKLKHGGPLPDEGEPVLIKKNGQGYMNGEIVECVKFEAGPPIGSVKTMWMTVSGGGRILVSFEGGGPKKNGVFFDGQTPWITDWKKYQIEVQRGEFPEPVAVTWGYCLTAHSAQGSQARRVTVFLDKADVRSGYFNKPTTLPSGEKAKFSARFVYTAMTRARKLSTMIVGR